MELKKKEKKVAVAFKFSPEVNEKLKDLACDTKTSKTWVLEQMVLETWGDRKKQGWR